MRGRKRTLGFVALALASVMGVLCSGAGVRAQPSDAPALQKTSGDAVGATVAHPARWVVEREQYTFDDTFGYTLWRPDSGEAHDHGGKPALRVALAYDLEPREIKGEVRRLVAEYSDVDAERQKVPVAREHNGVAVGPIPGSTPSTEVYVPVNGRVYRINVYAEKPGGEGLGEKDRELLSGLRFAPPSRSKGSLDLPRANSPEALYPAPGEAPPDTAKFPAGEQTMVPDLAAASSNAVEALGGRERRIKGGCWQADPDFYVQTIHGYKANSKRKDSRSGDRIPTGWTRIGVPNFWGQYTHGNLGYGRCKERNWANDKYAVDYPLNTWDAVFSPFSCGKVTFRGRNRTHADYGIFVVIRACNNKYVSLQAHFRAVKQGLRRGDRVNRNTIVGYAGASGGGNIAVGRTHVHQAYYRYPTMHRDGSPYGGASLQVRRLRYVGTAARRAKVPVRTRAYYYAPVSPDYNIRCREGRRCGEGYIVSN